MSRGSPIQVKGFHRLSQRSAGVNALLISKTLRKPQARALDLVALTRSPGANGRRVHAHEVVKSAAEIPVDFVWTARLTVSERKARAIKSEEGYLRAQCILAIAGSLRLPVSPSIGMGKLPYEPRPSTWLTLSASATTCQC